MTYSLQYGNYSIERRGGELSIYLCQSFRLAACLLSPQATARKLFHPPEKGRRKEKKPPRSLLPSLLSLALARRKGGRKYKREEALPASTRPRLHTAAIATANEPFSSLFVLPLFFAALVCVFAGEGKMEVRGNGGEKEKEGSTTLEKRGRSLFSVFPSRFACAEKETRRPRQKLIYIPRRRLPPPPAKRRKDKAQEKWGREVGCFLNALLLFVSGKKQGCADAAVCSCVDGAWPKKRVYGSPPPLFLPMAQKLYLVWK